ncbi:TIGR03808 family TAT-translocated repetitive protein [Devosia sp. ZB163]|uniref:TIGR03808 family TAT-translocated repetitive protein n=1 Tax=Devosia sp. ZB163 TaxID=3025938 RepID=UPI00235E7A4B|nr:TIGR03808 family TAT-translocated repetitive protein [Devosia sp. ZB163]MDC9823723.1 TIGR03808 family TAT-translocated repetitive protein [Devosia sp. ZB163]
MRHPSRRHILATLAALPLAGTALAQSLDPASLNLSTNSLDDQSGPLQEALLRAAGEGRRLFLPPGTYYVQNLQVPGNIAVEGIAGSTILAAVGDAPILRIAGSARVDISGLTFTRGNGGPSGADRGLVEVEASDHVAITNCTFVGGAANGLVVRDAAANIEDCDFTGHALAAILSIDSRGLNIGFNSITKCGNGGILIWGSQNRHDGSIVSSNTITGIGTSNGGNGQNGNGINVFRCNDVIVANNQIADCAFTAVRLNSTNNVAVTGNVCRNSGEVAIFSEFAFTGSVIANNVIDGAAAGISITNLDSKGRLAVCSGNVVRNIFERSKVNPDTRPVGIYVEADTNVSGNTVDNVPGFGILAGNGPFLQNVAIADNVLTGTRIGIGVSVVDNPPVGNVTITGNVIAKPSEHAIAGMAWDRVLSDDLIRDAARYPHVTLGANSVS